MTGPFNEADDIREFKAMLADPARHGLQYVARAHEALIREAKAEGRREAAKWLRARAAKIEAEVDDDCDGQDADRFCAEASLLHRAANDFARGSEP